MTPDSTAASPHRRLSPDRQELAARYVPLARRLALPWKRQWPHARDEFEGAALLALVQAAASFDPDRNVKFATFARFRIGGALRDTRRELLLQARSLGAIELDADQTPPHVQRQGRVLGIEPDRPVGWEIESRDAVDRWLRKLPARHAAACREIYLLGKSQLEAARAIGLSQSRLCSMHRDALEMLGQSRSPGNDGASSAPNPLASRNAT
jgi:RNA polymerase sigma factor (sigma-70 family)